MNKISELDKKESAFFSHQDPKMVEWFVNIVEERKIIRTVPRKRRTGNTRKGGNNYED